MVSDSIMTIFTERFKILDINGYRCESGKGSELVPCGFG